jgi:hypothetical protein
MGRKRIARSISRFGREHLVQQAHCPECASKQLNLGSLDYRIIAVIALYFAVIES